jgi:hypothetical protein
LICLLAILVCRAMQSVTKTVFSSREEIRADV